MAKETLYLVTADFVRRVEFLERWVRNFSLTGDGLSVNASRGSFSANLRLPRPPSAAAAAAGSSLARVKATSTTGVTGTINCKQVTKDTTTETGSEFAVQLTQGHAVGDVFFAIKSANGTNFVGVDWVEHLMLPIGSGRFRLVQVVDTTGRLGIDSARYE